MSKMIYLALPLILVPTLAAAQNAGSGERGPGSGSDIYKVMREIEAMQRDGRWGRLLAEGRADTQSLEATRQVGPSPVTATGSTRQRRRGR